ncbi:MAG: hybrid sensor histidine kinase/response regulator [Rhodocyclaceae bacterium]|nr:hybrid sensor histidine kinase/response regulator [Rhodocyclaceae bacterium]MBK6907152.1 hybrid sensor histidine kinase/response regulator [Rhodocyclaceae bacterium]
MTITSTESAQSSLLIVDDQPINIQLLYQIFSADHEVFMATSGVQALEFCAGQLPDLILLDVMMPDMDGHEVCRRLKADPRTRDIPVIFVTAQNDPKDEAQGLALGAVDFIFKPVNAAVVRARVHTHLLLRASLQQVRELNESLELRVAERTAELQLAMDSLHKSQEQLASSEAKATLSTLVASVSHEMGTPIGNSVMAASTLTDNAKSFAQMIESGSLKRSDLANFVSSLTEGTGMLLRNLERAKELLSSFRQVAADQASEQRREFDLAEVIREIIGTLTPTLKRHPHRVVVDIAPGIVMDSQPGPLGQIIINLINNAYLHAFEGRTDGVLTIHAEDQGDKVALSVTDNGCGIPEENLAKLFKPFFSTKIGHGGTGLGMAIVENLVNKTLGGQVSVQSVVGQGTRFDILLPKTLGGNS